MTGALRRAFIIVNPSKMDVVTLRLHVDRLEASEGWAESIWLETTADSPGADQARHAVAAAADLIVVAGGDGTVREVSIGLAGHPTPLGIVPAGTGNLLARNLRLPLGDVGSAVRIAFSAGERQIDVGRLSLTRSDGAIEEHSFLVMSGMGIDAQMILNTNPRLKKRVGWIAYVDAIARTLRTPTTLNARYHADREPDRDATVNTLLIGNCGAIQGRLRLLPGAKLDDGKLDFLALRSLRYRDRTSIGRWLSWENSGLSRFNRLFGMSSRKRETQSFRYGQARVLRVVLDHAEDFEVDGDSVGAVTAFTAWADESCLTVRV